MTEHPEAIASKNLTEVYLSRVNFIWTNSEVSISVDPSVLLLVFLSSFLEGQGSVLSTREKGADNLHLRITFNRHRKRSRHRYFGHTSRAGNFTVCLEPEVSLRSPNLRISESDSLALLFLASTSIPDKTDISSGAFSVKCSIFKTVRSTLFSSTIRVKEIEGMTVYGKSWT